MPEHRVAVVGAGGFGGALCAHIVHRHPSLELTALTARSDAGKRHDEVYARYRVPLTMEEFDPDVVAERADAALVAYPHKAAALAVKALARARPEGGRPVGGLPARSGALRALVPAPRGARAARRGRLRPARAAPRGDPRGVARRRSGLQLHRRAARAAAAGGTHRRGGRGHQGRGVRRRPRGHRGDALRLGRGQRQRLQGRGPPPHRRARAGAARRALQLRGPPAADRPGHPRQLLRTPSEPITAAEAHELPARPIATSRSSTSSTTRRARATCATPTAPRCR